MASSNSKKPRRNPHSGRARGSEIKTGKRGARKSPMSQVDLILMGKGAFTAIGNSNSKRAQRMAKRIKETRSNKKAA